MKKESTTFGLEPEQVQRLFNIGRDAKSPGRRMSRNERKAEMLRSRLSQTLPLDKPQIDLLPEALGHLCQTIGFLAGETIISLLKNPSAGMSLIERIKRYGRELSARAESEVEHEVATTIYYAAIASALVFHDMRITRFSYEKLEASFSRLAEEKWISQDLSVLFKIARKCCEEKARS